MLFDILVKILEPHWQRLITNDEERKKLDAWGEKGKKAKRSATGTYSSQLTTNKPSTITVVPTERAFFTYTNTNMHTYADICTCTHMHM